MGQRLTTAHLWVEKRATVLSVWAALACAVFTGLMYFHACSQSKANKKTAQQALAESKKSNEIAEEANELGEKSVKMAEELSFDSTGLKNRPLIEFEMPEKFDFSAQVMQPDPNEFQKSHVLKTKLTIKGQLKGVNNSPHVARIIAVATTDKATGSSELREMLFDEHKKGDLHIFPSKDYYKSLEVFPHKEHTFDISREISGADLENKEFVLHILVLYANEAGNLYDSYYWIRFRFKDLQAEVVDADEGLQLLFKKKDLMEYVQWLDSHPSTEMYSQSSSEELWRLVRKHSKEFLKEMQNKDK